MRNGTAIWRWIGRVNDLEGTQPLGATLRNTSVWVLKNAAVELIKSLALVLASNSSIVPSIVVSKCTSTLWNKFTFTSQLTSRKCANGSQA
jgi:hypothetical protein